jgi:F0F1-type ATP synthase assembly protein I
MLGLIAGFAIVLRSVLSMPDQGHTWFVGKQKVVHKRA